MDGSAQCDVAAAEGVSSLVECIGGNPHCPCQDGDACHYVDDPQTGTKAMAIPNAAGLPLGKRELGVSGGSPAPPVDPSRLSDALNEALALADEGWAYVSPHLREKWDYDGQRAAIVAMAAGQPEEKE